MDRSFLPVQQPFFRRERLIRMLQKGLGHSLVTVVAGPGYGKTQTVADFAFGAEETAVWLRLTELENDPVFFWESLVAAVGREMPRLAEEMEGLQFPKTVAQYNTFYRLAARHTAQKRTLFVADNHEMLRNRQVLAFCESVLAEGLDNTSFIIISKAKTPFGKYVPDKGQFRISAQDLAYTPGETMELFALYGIQLAQDEAEKLVQHTGGWPLALHVMCDRGMAGAGLDFAKSPHLQMAAEMFENEYYISYPKPFKDLLVGLSCYLHFSVDIIKESYEGDAEQALELMSKNIFVFYDYLENMFSMQPMYRNFLAIKRPLLDNGKLEALHRTAGRWFAENGYPFEGMEAFWACGDYEGFIGSCLKIPRRMMSYDYVETLLQRLESMPPAHRDDNPFAVYGRAMLYINNLQINRGKALLEELAGRLENQPLDERHRQLLGDVYFVLFDMSLVQNRDDGLPYLKRADALLYGCTDARVRELLVVGNNAVLYVPRGGEERLQQMVEYLHQCSRYMDRLASGSGNGFEWLFAAEAAYATAEMDKARENCYQAIQKAQAGGQYDIVCNARWMLVRVAMYYGDYPKARQELDALVAYIDDNRLEMLRELRDCAICWFHVQLGNAAKANYWLDENRYTGGELSFATGRNRIIAAMCLFAKGEHGQAYAILTQLKASLEERGHWYVRVMSAIIQAEYFILAGNEERAISTFKEVYTQLYPSDMKVILAECGKALLPLLEAVRRQNIAELDAAWLDEVYAEAVSYGKRLYAMARLYNGEHGIKPKETPVLTAREKEVLGLMVQGLTREEMARLMGISVDGVKKHATKIYTKLGALNRADAVHIADMQGLIGTE